MKKRVIQTMPRLLPACYALYPNKSSRKMRRRRGSPKALALGLTT
jgi:hypothetical protein